MRLAGISPKTTLDLTAQKYIKHVSSDLYPRFPWLAARLGPGRTKRPVSQISMNCSLPGARSHRQSQHATLNADTLMQGKVRRESSAHEAARSGTTYDGAVGHEMLGRSREVRARRLDTMLPNTIQRFAQRLTQTMSLTTLCRDEEDGHLLSRRRVEDTSTESLCANH